MTYNSVSRILDKFSVKLEIIEDVMAYSKIWDGAHYICINLGIEVRTWDYYSDVK